MRKVEINFAPAAKRNQWWEVPVLFLGVAGSVLVAFLYQQADARNEDWTDRVAKLRRAADRNDRDLNGIDGAPSAGALARDAQVATDKMWDALLDHLEDSIDETVTLLSFQVRAESRHVELQAEAKDVQSAFAFLERVGAGNTLVGVALTNQEVMRDHPLKPIRFNVSGKWKGDDDRHQ